MFFKKWKVKLRTSYLCRFKILGLVISCECPDRFSYLVRHWVNIVSKIFSYSKPVNKKINIIVLWFLFSLEIIKPLLEIYILKFTFLIQTGFFFLVQSGIFFFIIKIVLGLWIKIFVLINSELLFFQMQRSTSVGTTQISQKMLPFLELPCVDDGKMKLV